MSNTKYTQLEIKRARKEGADTIQLIKKKYVFTERSYR